MKCLWHAASPTGPRGAWCSECKSDAIVLMKAAGQPLFALVGNTCVKVSNHHNLHVVR
jgi:hypothetical protein